MKHTKLEHILQLSRGKKSGRKIGSRAIPHHLYKYETVKLEKALHNKYLEINSKDRENLQNLWYQICLSQGWDNYILVREYGSESGYIQREYKAIETGNYELLKEKIIKLV